MSDDYFDTLFETLRESYRQRLRALGWLQVQRWTRTYWHPPGQPDNLHPEEEAFAALVRVTPENPS